MPELWKNNTKLDRTITYHNADYIIKQTNTYPWTKKGPNLIEYNLKNINYVTNL
jgi:hypothetical protein